MARSLLALCALIRARLSGNPGGALLVAAGIAAAGAMLVSVGGVSVLARDAALERRLARLPEAERPLRVSLDRTVRRSGEYRAALEPLAVRALAGIEPRGGTVRSVLLHGVRVADGSVVQLVGVDPPGRAVRLDEGRLPRACRGGECEGVVVSGTPPYRRAVEVSGVRVRIVGRGSLSAAALGRLDAEVVTGTLGRSQEGRFGSDGRGTRVVVAGVEPLGESAALRAIPRTYYWARELPARDVHPWGADELVRRIAQAGARLTATDRDARLSAPAGAIRSEQARGRIAERRLLLLAGQAGAALLAFAAYAAGRRRRSVGEEWDRLRHAGARGWQLTAFVAMEAALLCGLGAIGGWLIAAAGTAVAAGARGLPAGAVLSASAAGSGGLVLALATWLVATVVVWVLLQAPLRVGGRVSARGLDAAALAALGVLVWEARARGGVRAGDLATGNTVDPILVLLPALVAFAAAVAVVRLLPPLLRALERALRGAGLALRLAVLAATREPGRTAAGVTFLAVSLATAVFALGYRASLLRGEADQAAFRIAADMRVTEAGATLSSPQHVLPLERYAALAGVHAAAVLRMHARTLGAGSTGVRLLGVPAAELPRLRGWRADFASEPIGVLARRLSAIAGLRLEGDAIPVRTRVLELHIRVRGSPISLTAVAQRPDGDFELIALGADVGPGTLRLRARLPARVAGGRLVALRVAAPRGEEAATLLGSTTFRPPVALLRGGSRRPLGSLREDWEPARRGELRAVPGGLRLSYALTGSVQATGLHRRQAGGGQAVPALVSAPLAGAAAGDHRLPAVLDSGATIELAVVGTTRLFPGVEPGGFAVADAGRLFRALNVEAPGTARPNEVWLRLDDPASENDTVRALRTGPFRAPHVQGRQAAERALRDDPLADAVVWALLVASALGLGLGAAGLALAVAMELRDESGELRELEAMGVTPRALRRQVRLRAWLIALLALASGLAGGVALTALITDLVAVTANATAPLPPLVAVQPWGTVALLLAAVTAALASITGLQTRRAFRGESAGRLHG